MCIRDRGSTAEAIQQQALMCEEIHKNTDSAEKETEAMIDKANHKMCIRDRSICGRLCTELFSECSFGEK